MPNKWLDYLKITLRKRQTFSNTLRSMIRESVTSEVRLMLLLKLVYMKLPKLNKRKRERIMSRIWNRRRIYRLWRRWRLRFILSNPKFHKNKKRRNNNYKFKYLFLI